MTYLEIFFGATLLWFGCTFKQKETPSTTPTQQIILSTSNNSLPLDSIRYVILASEYDKNTKISKSFYRIIDLKGKVYGEWSGDYRCYQRTDCLNFPDARLFLYMFGRQLLSIDRNGNTTDLSPDCFMFKDIGQNYTALLTKQPTAYWTIFNPNGVLVTKANGDDWFTTFSENRITVLRDYNWEIRDTAWELLHIIPCDLDTNEFHNQYGLQGGLIAIEKTKGHYFYFDKNANFLFELSKVIHGDTVLTLSSGSEGNILVNHMSLLDNRESWSYINSSGQIVWTTSDQNVKPHSLSNGILKISIKENKLDFFSKSKKNETPNCGVAKYIDKNGTEVSAEQFYQEPNFIRGKLKLISNKQKDINNQLGEYVIYDDVSQDAVFRSKTPIIYFDDRVVIVKRFLPYSENDYSQTVDFYDYKNNVLMSHKIASDEALIRMN